MSKAYYELLLRIINRFPDLDPLEVPEGVNNGLESMFGLLGFFFPYDIYAPLFTFIIAFTLFRISWSVFITFKK